MTKEQARRVDDLVAQALVALRFASASALSGRGDVLAGYRAAERRHAAAMVRRAVEAGR